MRAAYEQPPRLNSPCRGEGGLFTKKFQHSASIRRAQLSVATKTVRSDLQLQCYDLHQC